MSAFDLGVLVQLPDYENAIPKVQDLGFNTCQLCCWQPDIYSDELSKKVKKVALKENVAIAAIWTGWTGPQEWNFINGPATLGIIPEEYRSERVSQIKAGAEFAAMIEAPAIITHLGFLPENPKDPIYEPVVQTVEDIAAFCEDKGIGFWFETGQETPVTLLRLIEDAGRPNLGINFDTANLILYGKANPVDALDVFGKYVHNLHCKDGLYPTNGRELGKEVRLGEGKANFPKILTKLKQLNFQGELIIEREITGPKQIEDIAYAKRYIERAIKDIRVN